MKSENPLVLAEPKLRAWLLARMREQEIDPPVDLHRLESPDDYPRALHAATRDRELRARLEKVTLTGLREVAAGDLRSGPDACAVRNLAALAEGIELQKARPVLQAIAERGAFGGHSDGLEVEAEERILLALATLQTPGSLWPQWERLWRRDDPRLWPIATVGLRLSDPVRALAILPEVVRRAAADPGFPIGEVLWAYATDERMTALNVSEALAGLTADEKERCRAALRVLGAEDSELAAWLPAASEGFPEWARISTIKHCPRITESLVCR